MGAEPEKNIPQGKGVPDEVELDTHDDEFRKDRCGCGTCCHGVGNEEQVQYKVTDRTDEDAFREDGLFVGRDKVLVSRDVTETNGDDNEA